MIYLILFERHEIKKHLLNLRKYVETKLDSGSKFSALKKSFVTKISQTIKNISPCSNIFAIDSNRYCFYQSMEKGKKKKKRDTIKSYELKFHNLSKINSIHRE